METAIAIVVIALVTLLVNVGWRIFVSGSHAGTVKQRLTSIEETLRELQADFKKLSDVLVSLADMRGEILRLDDRLMRAENDIHEIRHGEGFVLPLRPIPERKP